MKSFRFKLQAVLTLREQEEQAAQQRWAHATAIVTRAAALLDAAHSQLALADEHREARLTAGLRAEEMARLRDFRVVLEEQQARLARDLAQARSRADQAKLQLVAATQRRETLERLRDRQRHAHEYEAARLDQKLLDELASRCQAMARPG